MPFFATRWAGVKWHFCFQTKTFYCPQVRDSHMAAAAKPPDFATQVEEEDIEVGDLFEDIIFFS